MIHLLPPVRTYSTLHLHGTPDGKVLTSLPCHESIRVGPMGSLGSFLDGASSPTAKCGVLPYSCLGGQLGGHGSIRFIMIQVCSHFCHAGLGFLFLLFIFFLVPISETLTLDDPSSYRMVFVLFYIDPFLVRVRDLLRCSFVDGTRQGLDKLIDKGPLQSVYQRFISYQVDRSSESGFIRCEFARFRF